MNQEYIDMLCSDNHLEHHGILGQKWGVVNGPPYPLGQDVCAMLSEGGSTGNFSSLQKALKAASKDKNSGYTKKDYKADKKQIKEYQKDIAKNGTKKPADAYTEMAKKDFAEKRESASKMSDEELKAKTKEINERLRRMELEDKYAEAMAKEYGLTMKTQYNTVVNNNANYGLSDFKNNAQNNKDKTDAMNTRITQASTKFAGELSRGEVGNAAGTVVSTALNEGKASIMDRINSPAGKIALTIGSAVAVAAVTAVVSKSVDYGMDKLKTSSENTKLNKKFLEDHPSEYKAIYKPASERAKENNNGNWNAKSKREALKRTTEEIKKRNEIMAEGEKSAKKKIMIAESKQHEEKWLKENGWEYTDGKKTSVRKTQQTKIQPTKQYKLSKNPYSKR